MTRSMRRHGITLFLLAALPGLMGSNCRKDKDDGLDDTDASSVAQEFDNEMSVVSIDPRRANAGESFSATLRGGGFDLGARAYLGASEVEVGFVDASTLTLDIPGLIAGRYDIEVVNPDGESSVLRGGLTIEEDVVACESLTVYFPLDSSSLTSEAREVLEANLDCYRDQGGPIRIEGHCDERGTTDYNLALGQRRAQAVARYLTGAGIASSRVSTVSYGEERPAVTGSGESTWSKNRRAEILLGR